MPAEARSLRCAIYTRKSSEEELVGVLGSAIENSTDKEALCEAARERSATWSCTAPADIRSFLSEVLSAVIVQPAAVEIKLSPARLAAALLGKEVAHSDRGDGVWPEADENPISFRVDARLRRCGGEVRLVAPSNGEAQDLAVNHALLKAVARAHAWYEELTSGQVASFGSIAKRLGVHHRYVGRMIRSAFIAPDIVEAILAGRQPPTLSVEKLRFGVPLLWQQQRKLLGLT